MMTKKIKLMVVEEMVIKMTMMIRNEYLNKSNGDPRKEKTGKGGGRGLSLQPSFEIINQKINIKVQKLFKSNFGLVMGPG